MAYQIGSRVSDGVISEPSSSSMVSLVVPDMPQIRSYLESSTDFHVVHPSSTFELPPPDEYVRWRTNWGSAPASCGVRQTLGALASVYGTDSDTTWSPSCWNLDCPEPHSTVRGSYAMSYAPNNN